MSSRRRYSVLSFVLYLLAILSITLNFSTFFSFTSNRQTITTSPNPCLWNSSRFRVIPCFVTTFPCHHHNVHGFTSGFLGMLHSITESLDCAVRLVGLSIISHKLILIKNPILSNMFFFIFNAYFVDRSVPYIFV